jgi:predicted tellurium resistance membrane protein TerC
MPLSDAERQAIDEIERALIQDDPRFASSVSVERFAQLRRRWVVIPAVMFALGAVMLVAGLVTTHALLAIGATVAVIGFVTMSGSILLFLRHHPAAQSRPADTDNDRQGRGITRS